MELVQSLKSTQETIRDESESFDTEAGVKTSPGVKSAAHVLPGSLLQLSEQRVLLPTPQLYNDVLSLVTACVSVGQRARDLCLKYHPELINFWGI